jgi:signal transduction histidine kinase
MMNVRTGILLIGWALLFLCGAPKSRAADADRHVSVWVIPPEASGPNDLAQGEDIPSRMRALRLALAGTRVRLLNVEDPLAAKTGSHRSGNSGEAGWFPEYTGPNFQVVANQRKTFAALARFAEQNNVDVVLRLITWREAFELLRAARTTGPDALPDVMEVGTTWTANLAANGRIRSRPDWRRSRGNWRDVLGIPASALPYTTDARLLFYWKRLPSAQPDSPRLTLNNASWPALLESIGSGTSSSDIIALPTAITLNLLYDYVPLAKAGGNQSLIHNGLFGPRVSFSSDSALAVPVYLAEHSSVPLGKGEVRQLISFPETTHEEVTRAFVNGDYRATLEPVSFMGRWADDFNERQRKNGKPQRFWDYAAAVVPPEGFKGGGELVVSSGTSQPELAFKLADYLATDPEYTEMLAQTGFLPPGKPGYGVDAFVESLASDERDVRDARIFGEVVQKAIDRGDRYPDFARWTDVFENRAVLEKLQRVWRGIAEGDVADVRQAAKDVDWEINSQIYMPSRALNAFIQSWRLVAVIVSIATFLVVAVELHRRRLRQVAQQFDMRLEERINERTRIARDLHDTLLQSLHGLMFQFQAARNILPRSPEKAMESLDEAIGETEKALAESRDAIQGLRSEPIAKGDLADLLKATSQQLPTSEAENQDPPVFDLIEEGERKTLSPATKNEICRIAFEILRNAYRHAHAHCIEAEIRYDAHMLRLRIRDDGRGIDPKVLKEGGRAGHWGLRGLRERAERIGARLDFWSEAGAGTEVQLAVPAAVAYETVPDTVASKLLRKVRNRGQHS